MTEKTRLFVEMDVESGDANIEVQGKGLHTILCLSFLIRSISDKAGVPAEYVVYRALEGARLLQNSGYNFTRLDISPLVNNPKNEGGAQNGEKNHP